MLLAARAVISAASAWAVWSFQSQAMAFGVLPEFLFQGQRRAVAVEGQGGRARRIDADADDIRGIEAPVGAPGRRQGLPDGGAIPVRYSAGPDGRGWGSGRRG